MTEEKENRVESVIKLLIKLVILLVVFILIVFGACAGFLARSDAQQNIVINSKVDQGDFDKTQKKFEIKFKDYSSENKASYLEIKKDVEKLDEKFDRKIGDLEDKMDSNKTEQNKKIDLLNGNVIKMLMIIEKE